MTAVALQRVIVRMHFDAGFAARVIAGGESPSELSELSERERSLLRSLDVRAFLTDPLRPSRAVHALVEELPASAAVAGVPAFFEFLRSSAFHQCVQTRGVMVFACAAWLASAERAGAVAVVEGTVARARRRRAPKLQSGELARSAHIEVAPVPPGTVEALAEILQRLGDQPTDAVMAGARAPRSALPEGQGAVLVEGESVSSASPALCALLTAADAPRPRHELLRVARELGADKGEDEVLLADLQADGLLVGGPRDPR